MKIIDLLNKIANGEEVPKRIRAFGTVFNLETDREYYSENSSNPLMTYFGEIELIDELNQFVEVVEDTPNKISKLSWQQVGYQTSMRDERELKEVVIDFNNQNNKMGKKINEIIKEINNLKVKEK